MSLIDGILNLAGLLLWLNWLSPRLQTRTRAATVSLAGTLSRVESVPPSKKTSLLWLLGLILFRGVLYFEIGPSADWTPHLQLGLIVLSFSSYSWRLMLLFSALGMLLTLVFFYLSLLLISIANSSLPDKEPLQKLVRLHLGWVERWPLVIKWLLPPLIAGLAWFALHPLLSHFKLIPLALNRNQIATQSLIFATSGYLGWKYLVGGILLLHMVNSYVYLGNHPFWLYLNQTARNLLWPLRWLPLRLGRVDFTPVVAVALVFFLSDFAAPKLFEWLYSRLRL